MAIDIESPGGDEADLKAALHALGMPVKLGWGDVTDDQYFETEIPAGYDLFEIYMIGLTASEETELACVFSTDGGSTWICDSVNNDTYFWGNTAAYALGAFGPMSGIELRTAPVGATATIKLTPGDANNLANVYAFWNTIKIGAQYSPAGSTGLNPNAAVTPTAARINRVRWMPQYADAGVNPPVSGITFTHGEWYLYGLG